MQRRISRAYRAYTRRICFISLGSQTRQKRVRSYRHAPILFQRSVRRSDAGPGEKVPAENTVFSLPAGAPHDVVGEHLKLKRLIRNNAALWTELAAQAAQHASANGSDDCWGPLRDEFPTLRLFPCGLASVFPGSSTVESDFRILTFNKNDNRTLLADLSVEGEFLARQWIEVERQTKLA
jgi:hypothetical protein